MLPLAQQHLSIQEKLLKVYFLLENFRVLLTMIVVMSWGEFPMKKSLKYNKVCILCHVGCDLLIFTVHSWAYGFFACKIVNQSVSQSFLSKHLLLYRWTLPKMVLLEKKHTCGYIKTGKATNSVPLKMVKGTSSNKPKRHIELLALSVKSYQICRDQCNPTAFGISRVGGIRQA